MRHYRVNKVAKPGGAVLKRRDTLAVTDAQAVDAARNDADCPVCEVWRDGRKVATID